MNISELNKRQFTNKMIREGQNITDYYSQSTYRVFFKRVAMIDNKQDELMIYYNKDTNISIGTVFTYNNNNYLVINKIAIESNLFFLSTALKCTCIFPVYDSTDHLYHNIPFVVEKQEYGVDENKNLTVISGSLTIYTGLNNYVEQMSGNYNNFGGTYSVQNHFYNNGLAYVYLNREMNSPDTYTLIYNGLTSLNVSNGTYQLSYIASINNIAQENPTLNYESDNTNVATVSSTGLLTILTSGTVNITATWVGV